MAVPVAAETLFEIGPLPVTNSLLTGWIAVAVVAALAFAVSRPSKGAPRGLQNAAEALIELMLSFMDRVTGDRTRSERFLPLVGALFLFILVSNWMGLVPGVGTIGIPGEHGLVPLFRPATSDLNMTLAMGITAVVVSHVFGMATLGFFAHWGKFFQFGGLWSAFLGFGRKPVGEAAVGVFTAVVETGVGLIELISEAAKMISLSLRLFGNIFAGEVLLHVLSSLIAFVLPTPFMFLELVVGVVQALVFSMLTLVYLTLATEKPHGTEDHGAGEARAAAAH
jgi:F-type H+-transporting ATPase subunit a